MSARARRDPAAEGRELEALGEVSQREPVRAEGILERRAEYTRLDSRGARGAVDLDHAIERRRIEADCSRIVITEFAVSIECADPRLDASHHARTSAVWDGGNVARAAPVEHGCHLGLVPWHGDEVRRGGEVAAQRADHVAVALAIGMAGTRERITVAERAQGGWGRDPRLRQYDIFDARFGGQFGVGAETLGDRSRNAVLLGGVGSRALGTPAPEAARAVHSAVFLAGA